MTDNAEKMARAHTNLNIWHAIITLLESGTLYNSGAPDSNAAERVIKICKAETAKELRIYDRMHSLLRPKP
jgi:hypothetical protein